ncbi:MAG: choice-of-anchor J domain-containing protein [Balneolales bacterium]|nr:choice-of-anchor J domain-containing protein [Balneolales bacterium]
MCLFPVAASAQSSGVSLTAQQERNTFIINNAGIQTADRQAIVNRFTEAEIRFLGRIAPDIFSTFDVASLEVILAAESRELVNPSFAQQQILDEYHAFRASQMANRVQNPILLEFNPDLDEVLSVSAFSVVSAPNGGSPVVFEVEAGVETSGMAVGFTFEGTVAGITDNGTWASDLLMVIESPSGETYQLGGFGGDSNPWGFDGGGSTNDGTYISTHVGDDIFGEGGTMDAGTWIITFSHGWNSVAAAQMDWTDVSVTLHKEGGAGGADNFVFEIPEVPFAGGEFEAIDEMFTGELFGLLPDFFPVDMQGFTWTNDFALLFVDGDLETGERVLQVGGTTNLGAAARINWTGGGNAVDPVITPVEFANPLVMDGLTVFYGNGWTPSPGGTWGGTIEFVFEADEPEPIPGEIIWEQTVSATNGIVSGFFAGEGSGTGAYSADDFSFDAESEITVLSVEGFYGQGFTPAGITSTGWFIFPDADGVPAGNPETSPEAAVWSYIAAQGDEALVISPGGRISLNVFQTGQDLILPPGKYWLAFHTSQAGAVSNARWNWYAGAPVQLDIAKLITPGTAFGGAFPAWTNLTGVDPVFAGLAFSITGFLGEPVDPVDPIEGEIIINGTFDNGLNSWTPYVADFAGVNADFSVVDGEAAITNMTGPTNEVWFVQLNQVFTQEQIAELEVGETYVASFDARSAVDGRQLRFYFGEDGGGFVPVNITDFNLTTSMETYQVTFELTNTFGAMKLGFEMGLSNADVFLDNVSLMLAPESDTDPIAGVSPDSIEFDLGIGESATSVLEVLNLAGMGADDLEFSIAVENAAARNYSSGVRTQFATVQGADRASGAVTPAGTIDAVVAHNAALMAIDEFSEGFADIETLPADGWSLQNLSTPVGTTTWFQGNPAVFPAFSGEETHYIGANFNSTTGSNTINTWLLTPEVTLQNGTELRFYTRSTGGNFPDRLEVRLSTAGGSTNAGTDPASTGDFTTLMLTVNPDLVTGPNGYPDEWTEFVATVEGLDAATTGRFGLRYFVTSGGPAGDNSDYIGIDEVRVVQPENGETPEPLVVDPTSGSVSAGGSAMVNVTANTQGLMVGSYGYNLLITTNDPANGLITFPVTVDVNDDSFAQVQVIHNAADPALAEVDVYVNGGLFATNFPFRGATEYLTVPANVELTLEIMAPGGSEALLSLSVVPEADESYAVIAQGVADPDGFAPNPDGLEIGAELVVLTDRQATGGGDTFDFYVFHGATDAPAVDVFVRELGTNILTGVPYGTGSGYFSVDPGVYVIEIRPAGSTTPVAAFIADVTGFGGLSAGILASGFLNPDQGEAFGLLVALETGDTAFIPGTTGPSLLITPSALAFGEVAEGFFAEQMVTFTNAGTSNLIIFDATTDNDAFSVDFGDVEIVSPGGTRTFTVTFSPDVAGEYSGDLLVETNDPAGVKTAALTGTGVFGASVVFDPSEIVAELAANTSDTFELTITNEGNGALEFAFPDYIMERILDGTDTRFDAVRQRMMVQVRSAFENTEEQMNANLQRFMMNEAGISGESSERSASAQSSESADLNSDGFLIEFESATFSGGQFLTVADGLNGELTAVNPNFVMDVVGGGTWTSDFAVLFTTEPLETGAVIDPSTVVFQAGGLTLYGPAGTRVAWAEGQNGTIGIPITTPIAPPAPFDMSGLYVSIGHGWSPGPATTWSGSIELVGVSAGADFITEVVPAFGVVAPGDSETITLTLDAAGLIGGVYTGVLGVLTNDPANPEVAIPATLTVFGEPIADVDPAELDFGSVFVGNSVTDGVLLTNTGSDVLLVSGFSTDSEEFVVSSQELELEAGESVVINISFAPESDGNKSAMLTIESNASNGDVTVALSGVGSNAGILSFDPSSFSVTVEQGATSTATLLLTNEGESDLEFNIGTSNTVAPTSGRSILVRNERSAQAIDQVSSLSNSMRISGSNATLQSAAPGWHAVRQTMPSVLNSETEIIWNQQNNGTGGGVSDFFQPLGSGAYSADDFLLEEGANLQVITAYGFVGPADGVPITTGANGVGIFIYPDNNGLPAGHPQDGQNSHVFSFTGGFNSAGLTIIEEAAGAIFTDIVLDIEAATGSALNLPAGTYWIMVFVDTNGQLGGPARWNWSQGEPNLNSGQLIDPGGLFGANTNWQSWAGITNGDWSDLAFMIEGNFGSFVDTDPAQGVIAPGGSVEVVVTFDATDLEPGDYFANINITTNSPITPSATIPVAMTVEEGAGQPSELVTFQVDMSVQSSLGNFNPGVGDEVFVRGSFNDWSVITGEEMTDSGEMVYTYTVELFGEAGTLYEYKYFILAGDGRELPNGGWEFDSVGEGGSTNRQVFLTGDDQTLPVVFFNNQDAVNVEPEFDMPTEFALKQNYPNPFNPTTNIVYALPEASEVTLEVFNLQGQRVAVLVRGQQTAGFHTVNFDASRLASGMYLYRLQAGNFVQTQKMMLVK